MTWLHKFFGLFFIPANGRAKSVQQLITMLPYHPLYFPRIKSLKKRKKLLSINFYHYFKKRIHISLIFLKMGRKYALRFSHLQQIYIQIHQVFYKLPLYFVKYLQAGAKSPYFSNFLHFILKEVKKLYKGYIYILYFQIFKCQA